MIIRTTNTDRASATSTAKLRNKSGSLAGNFMKNHALAVFRKSPKRCNCAQSVLHAWREVSGDESIALAALKSFGSGRAPGGLCGALYAACLVVPVRAEVLKSVFAARLGSLYCRQLRAIGIYTCETCVSQAAELLEFQTGQHRSKTSAKTQIS